eukprot:4496399-Alexandrium_andersonii.AAC.1
MCIRDSSLRRSDYLGAWTGALCAATRACSARHAEALVAHASAQTLMLHCMHRLRLDVPLQCTTWQGNWTGSGLRDK